MPTPQEVYTRRLIRKDPSRGFPLYKPEPDESLPPDYRACGPRIGDLGYISDSDGGFNFLFNLCLPADHPFNQVYGVPKTFQQVKLRVGEERDHEDVQVRPNQDPVGTILSSRLVDKQHFTSTIGARSTIQYTSLKHEGAMLELPHGTEKRDLVTTRELETVAGDHAQLWYQFICTNLGQHVNNNSLYVVTGHHKASSWCLGSFSQEAGDTTGHEWKLMDPINKRVSPCGFDKTQSKQAVFLRGITITLRDHPTAMLQGKKVQPEVTVSPHTWRRNIFSCFCNPDPSEIVTVNEDGNSEPLHPAVMINKYLLNKFPKANVAITCDIQWMGAVPEKGGGHKKMIKNICKRFKPRYNATNGVAYFVSKNEPKF